jgi:O-antigen ligase
MVALVLLVDARLSVGLVIAGLIVLPLIGPAFYERLILASNEYSVFTRIEAARILLEIIKTSPVFGLGPANYYWYTPLYSILGYFVPFNSHNNYLDLLAQTGIVSVVLFGWFLVRVTAQGVRLFRQAQPGFIKAYSAACLAAVPALLVSAMLGDWVIPFPYNIGMSGMRSSFFTFLFLGGLAVIEYRHSRLPFSRESAPPAASGVPR